MNVFEPTKLSSVEVLIPGDVRLSIRRKDGTEASTQDFERIKQRLHQSLKENKFKVNASLLDDDWLILVWNSGPERGRFMFHFQVLQSSKTGEAQGLILQSRLVARVTESGDPLDISPRTYELVRKRFVEQLKPVAAKAVKNIGGEFEINVFVLSPVHA